MDFEKNISVLFLDKEFGYGRILDAAAKRARKRTKHLSLEDPIVWQIVSRFIPSGFSFRPVTQFLVIEKSTQPQTETHHLA